MLGMKMNRARWCSMVESCRVDVIERWNLEVEVEVEVEKADEAEDHSIRTKPNWEEQYRG